MRASSESLHGHWEMGLCSTSVKSCKGNLLQTLKRNGVVVYLGGGFLSVCDKARTLGDELDCGLKFSDHVTFVIQRALVRLKI